MPWTEGLACTKQEGAAMDGRIIVVIFDNEKKAYEGSKALKDLHAEGSITLYASAVIAKDDGGKVTVKQTTDQGPLGTGVGLITGSLIGLLGGPVSVPLGAEDVTFVGLLYDLAKVGVGEDFLGEVGQHLQPGKVAVVAEMWEEWVMPVDTHMEAAGGVVFRRARADILDSEIVREAAALKAEIDDLKAEYARADAIFNEAQLKLRERVGVSSRAEYERLNKTLDEAWGALNKVRSALDRHIREHRCESKMHSAGRSRM